MKKLLMVLVLMLVLVMAACSSDNENNAENTNDENTAGKNTNATDEGNNAADENAGEDNAAADKAAVLNGYLDLATQVRPNTQAINAYLGSIGSEDVDAATLETLKADAIAAAGEASSTVEGYTVEINDADLATKFDEFKAELKAAYDEYATALEADEPDVTAAEEKITSANDILTEIFESVGLRTPDLAGEIS